MIDYEMEGIGEVKSAHELLKKVYGSPLIPLAVRMRAAMAAIPFESAKFAVVAQVSERDVATLLDQRIKHLETVENGNGKIIERQPVETKPRLPRLADRRYRRL